MINGGTDSVLSLYEMYDEAVQKSYQSSFEFDAYLTSLKGLMDSMND